MPIHVTREGLAVNVRREHADSGEAQVALITSVEEWERIAGGWPLKRLVEIWNSLPGVAAVRKFTSRRIALERIWRALENPEPDVERQNRTKSQKANFREGSKRRRCTHSCAGRKEQRCARCRRPRAGSGTVCAGSSRRASASRAVACALPSVQANACTGSRAKALSLPAPPRRPGRAPSVSPNRPRWRGIVDVSRRRGPRPAGWEAGTAASLESRERAERVS